MSKFFVSYFAVELLIVVAAVAATLWHRKRRLRPKQQKPPAGFVRTDEVFYDPTLSVKQQVWFNPRTGERYYETIEE